jgi:hypothetical protein
MAMRSFARAGVAQRKKPPAAMARGFVVSLVG